MTAKAFLTDIIANPGDDTPRLVYADWLDDHGDADRSEFIRIQVELSRSETAAARRAELLERQKVLLDANERAWRAELPRLSGVRWLGWSRGFVGAVRINSGKAFREHAAAVFSAAPVQELELGGQVTGRTVPEILASPLLASLTRLYVYRKYLGDAVAEVIANSPHLANLRSLVLGHCGFGPAGIAALAGSAHLTRLRELHLDGNPVRDEGAATLAASSLLLQVEVLHLYGTQLGDAGTEALARSPHFSALRELRLGGNQIGDAGIRALAGSHGLGALQVLPMIGNRITDDGAAALASRAGLPALTELHLGGNPITDAGAVALAAGSAMDRIQRLTFYNYTDQIGPEGIAALRERFGDRVEIR
jgi:uncharacterized protein (TIGR02996 family)